MSFSSALLVPSLLDFSANLQFPKEKNKTRNKMMAVGEIFLSAFINLLFEKLIAVELLKFASLEGIDSHLKKWTKTLSMIQAVLGDAEDKQNAAAAVKEWLNDLQDLAYDLDDIVDELSTEALRRKSKEAQASTSKVQKLFLTSCCSNLSIHSFMFDTRLASKMKDMNGQLEYLVEQISILNLVKRPKDSTSERSHTTSLVNEHEMFGRETDKERLVELLLPGESCDSQVTIVPMVGMGGVGKTSLVRLLYNDERINFFFKLKVWCCVTDDFDIFRVTRMILEAVTSRRCEFEGLDSLQVELKKHLSGKMFLIVLDDVWIETYEELDNLLHPLMVGLPGSKIVVTTRNERVALAMSSVMPSVAAYHLKELNDDDSLSLLAHYALENRSFETDTTLEKVGRLIVKKCENLPLAIKALGRLLSTKRSLNEWINILNSEMWDLPNTQRDILPALQLSYKHLPSHFKRCFTYCAIFPKGYQFDKHELVFLWMGEGLLQQTTGKKTMEELGSDYFDELISRSFFQLSSVDTTYFVMHDLINDLSKHVAGKICFRLEDQLENQRNAISLRSRHMSYARREYDFFSKFEAFYNIQGLRTFLPLLVEKSPLQEEFFLSNKVVFDLIPRLGCLRVLSLAGYSIYQLPNSIGHLKHVRYLNLSGTTLKRLPESVSSLTNLQTLIVRDCKRLLSLPFGLKNLVNLRHLDNANTVQLQEMPPGIGQLTSLQTLSKIVVSKSSGLKPKDLGNLLLLRGALSIVELQNITKVEDAREANLKSKLNIDELKYAWSFNFDDSRDENSELGVLDALEPSKHLRTLTVEFYGGVQVSNWIGDSSFSKLSVITFNGCWNCSTLPPLGQLPSLKDLSIQGMHQLKVLGTEFYGKISADLYFPSLETLRFEDMPKWEEWSRVTIVAEEAAHFPCLRILHISGCSNLKSIPLLKLPSLCELELQECDEAIVRNLTTLSSLTKLRLKSIKGLTSISDAFMQFPFRLEVLEISSCNELANLWQSGDLGQSLHHLRLVEVKECPEITSLQEISALPMLKYLHVADCNTLQILPSRMSCLEDLRIRNCSFLKSSEPGEMTSTLKHLEIIAYMDADLVSRTMLKDSSKILEYLEFNKCPYLNIKDLLGSVQRFTNLCFLSIIGCNALESFPEEGLPVPQLASLLIWDCRNIKFLPNHLDYLTSLKNLVLMDCPDIVSFPQGELPPKLTSLWIWNCGKLKPLSEWCHKCTSLRHLIMCETYPGLVSFSLPENEECLLPPNLWALHIGGLQNLESLSKGLEKLSFLRHLQISDCPKLHSLPKKDLLDKLWSLTIANCPLLEKKCLKKRGKYWPVISNIPCVKVDDLPVNES